jgi:hypothetical protein
MTKRNPDKARSLLRDPDPVGTAWHKLFLFWEAYDDEFTILLTAWHDDAAQRRAGTPPRSSGNVLYDSFLDTWGKGNFVDPNVPLDKKSYFAALAVASMEPKAICLGALEGILKTKREDGCFAGFEDPLQLTVSPEKANEKAKEALATLVERFSNEFNALDQKVDPKLREAIGQSSDTYLKALIRMMDIETECFKVQRDFLVTGKVS